MMLFVNIVFLVLVVWREWLAWLLPPLAAILVTRWRADKQAVATACTAAFLSFTLTWTPGLDMRGWHTILPGFQERYLWLLLPLLAIGMDAADNAQELGQGNPRSLKDLRHQPL